MAGDIDYYEDNADWLHLEWSFAPYKSEEFYKQLKDLGATIDEFKRWQVYLHSVRIGLIVDDEWTGKTVDLHEPWLRDGVELATQMDVRAERVRMEIISRLADAQGEAGRTLTQEETGLYLLDYLDDKTVDMLDGRWINVGDADTSGIDELQKVAQDSAWFAVLSGYSSFVAHHIAKIELPQIWMKPGARAVYYPKRNLIVVPNISLSSFPQVAHAAAHFIETLGRNQEAATIARNRLALPGTLHMIRPGLYGLRGPWLDQHDGALRGHDVEWLAEQYTSRRMFTAKEISYFFQKRPTEYLAMMAQRVIRRDPVELAAVWTRNPEQLLFYVSLASGNFLESL